ncbi:MAG TPA: type II secretion system protein [Sedimentisphaerales bacterium]|nr:type II secretion system protein [Sedimentisphaerales bacterium]HRS10019.1 type II secretion system protein [Sedimentisphaerales bacterium]HRV46725.1 type II secretion system protein [Sedimentisphaerales bacterium]
MSNTRREDRVRGAGQGGFTFVELLATVVLIGIIMPVAMRTISLCTALAGRSRREIEAVSLASTKLAELVASKDWETGGKAGDFGTDWPGYQWNAEVSNWTESTVRQLDVQVLWTSQGRQRQVMLSTLVYPEEK